MKILFLIRSLGRGGAEQQLTLLAQGLRAAGHEVAVAVFYAGGPLEKPLRRNGIPIHDLAKGGRWDMAGFLTRLTTLVRREKPRILHPYLVEPNILSLLPRWLTPSVRVVWGVRASFVDLDQYDTLTKTSFRLSCRLSPLADLILCNSRSGAEYHIACGYPRGKIRVIPNGFDCERFKPDAIARETVRRQWGIGPGQFLVGLPARLDPIKDHPTFLRAAKQLLSRRPETRFVCIGGGPQTLANSLQGLAREMDLGDRLIWTGDQEEMPALYSAMDLAVSASLGEGFSNTLGEAMACGVPCVATDVGDSAWILENTGLTVPPGQPDLLASAMEKLLLRLEKEGASLGGAARHRILTHFTPGLLVQRSMEAMESLK